jgi:hypothetical protein
VVPQLQAAQQGEAAQQLEESSTKEAVKEQ